MLRAGCFFVDTVYIYMHPKADEQPA